MESTCIDECLQRSTDILDKMSGHMHDFFSCKRGVLDQHERYGNNKCLQHICLLNWSTLRNILGIISLCLLVLKKDFKNFCLLRLKLFQI